jgi:hypothetical protein
MWQGEKHGIGLLSQGLRGERLKGQRDSARQAGEDGGDWGSCGFLRRDHDDFKIGMERGKADEFGSGIAASSRDRDANLSHSGVPMRQQPSSWILAALKPSTYLKPYASGFRLLWPCWKNVFIILLTNHSGYSCRHKKREGRKPSLFPDAGSDA